MRKTHEILAQTFVQMFTCKHMFTRVSVNAVFNMQDQFLSWYKCIQIFHCPCKYFSRTIPFYVSWDLFPGLGSNVSQNSKWNFLNVAETCLHFELQVNASHFNANAWFSSGSFEMYAHRLSISFKYSNQI